MIIFNSTDYNNPNKHYTDVRPAASLKSGGAGIRYTCYIDGKKTYLFLEENKWFYELCR